MGKRPVTRSSRNNDRITPAMFAHGFQSTFVFIWRGNIEYSDSRIPKARENIVITVGQYKPSPKRNTGLNGESKQRLYFVSLAAEVRSHGSLVLPLIRLNY